MPTVLSSAVHGDLNTAVNPSGDASGATTAESLEISKRIIATIQENLAEKVNLIIYIYIYIYIYL